MKKRLIRQIITVVMAASLALCAWIPVGAPSRSFADDAPTTAAPADSSLGESVPNEAYSPSIPQDEEAGEAVLGKTPTEQDEPASEGAGSNEEAPAALAPVCRIVSTGTEYDSLAEAVAAASSGDVINITADNTVSTVINAGTKTLTLRNGAGSTAVTTFSKDGSLATAGNFTLGTCTFDGGRAASGGRSAALITISGGTFSVEGAAIANVYNWGTTSPGGVFNVASGTLAFKDGTVTNCLAKSDSNMTGQNGGSAAFVQSGATMIFSGGTISGCGSYVGPQYHLSALYVRGVFRMTGGTLRDNNGSHGGAIYGISSAKVELSGGTLSGNKAYYDGGALFLHDNAKATVSGTVLIENNSAQRNGGAIGMRKGVSLAIEGGSLRGNNIVGGVTDARGGAVSGYDDSLWGTVTVSGSPVIEGNTYQGTTKADLAVVDAKKLVIGNLTESASVGIFPSAGLDVLGSPFAVAAGDASSVKGLDKLFHDGNPVGGANLAGGAGAGTSVVWVDPLAVCKIVNGGTTTPFTSLSDALAVAKGKTGTTTIEMLVQTYEVAAPETLAMPAGTEIVLTTAKTAGEGCADGYPYQGPAGTPATIKRAFAGTSMFSVTGGAMTFEHITVDGNKANFSGETGGILSGSGGAAIRLADGCVFKDSKTTISGGALHLQGAGTTLLMESGARGEHCETDGRSGGFLHIDSEAAFTATGGVLAYNMATVDQYGSGGAILAVNGAVVDLQGSFEAYGNQAAFYGPFSYVSNDSGKPGAVLKLGGFINLHDNNSSSANTGAVHAFKVARVEVQGAPTVSGNVAAGAPSNVYISTPPDMLRVTGDLTGGEVGVNAPTTYARGDCFGKATVEAASVHGLEHLKNDRNVALSGMAGASTDVVWGVVGDVPVTVKRQLSSTQNKDTWFVVEVKDLRAGTVYRQPIRVPAGSTEGSATIVLRSGLSYSFQDLSHAGSWRQGATTPSYSGPETPTGTGPVELTLGDADPTLQRTLVFSSQLTRTQWLSDDASVVNKMS